MKQKYPPKRVNTFFATRFAVKNRDPKLKKSYRVYMCCIESEREMARCYNGGARLSAVVVSLPASEQQLTDSRLTHKLSYKTLICLTREICVWLAPGVPSKSGSAPIVLTALSTIFYSQVFFLLKGAKYFE